MSRESLDSIIKNLKASRQFAANSFGDQGEVMFDQDLLNRLRGGKQKNGKKEDPKPEPRSIYDLI